MRLKMPGLLDLPVEVLAIIVENLPKREWNKMTDVCEEMSKAVEITKSSLASEKCFCCEEKLGDHDKWDLVGHACFLIHKECVRKNRVVDMETDEEGWEDVRDLWYLCVCENWRVYCYLKDSDLSHIHRMRCYTCNPLEEYI